MTLSHCFLLSFLSSFKFYLTSPNEWLAALRSCLEWYIQNLFALSDSVPEVHSLRWLSAFRHSFNFTNTSHIDPLLLFPSCDTCTQLTKLPALNFHAPDVRTLYTA